MQDVKREGRTFEIQMIPLREFTYGGYEPRFWAYPRVSDTRKHAAAFDDAQQGHVVGRHDQQLATLQHPISRMIVKVNDHGATPYALMMLGYARTETQWRKFNGPLVMPRMVVA